MYLQNSLRSKTPSSTSSVLENPTGSTRIDDVFSRQHALRCCAQTPHKTTIPTNKQNYRVKIDRKCQERVTCRHISMRITSPAAVWTYLIPVTKSIESCKRVMVSFIDKVGPSWHAATHENVATGVVKNKDDR